MGLSSSIVQPGCREVAKSRWPPTLQNATLPLLCAYYTAFSELPSVVASTRQLAQKVGFTGDELRAICNIWGGALQINVWELLMSLVLTSAALSVKTKVAFIFRMCDEDGSHMLEAHEMTAMCITFMRSIGAYLHWPCDSQPTVQVVRKFVHKKFSARTSEKHLAAWVVQQPVLLAILHAFTPKRLQAKDSAVFELNKPLGKPVTGPNSLLAYTLAQEEEPSLRRRRVSRIGLPPIGAAPVQNKCSEVSCNKSQETHSCTEKAESKCCNSAIGKLPLVALPSIVSDHPAQTKEERRKSLLNGQIGRRGHLPELNGERHRCALHKNMKSECMLLTKHEVWLSHALWQILREHGASIDTSAIKFILQTLARSMCGESWQEDSSGLFALSSMTENPLFAVCVGRMRAGVVVTFREFLQDLCPCASHAQIECFEKFDLTSWLEEKQFVEAVGQWLRDSSDHWRKPVLQPETCRDLAAQFGAMDVNDDSHLSVGEICKAALPREDAEEFVTQHDLDGDGSINVNEFIQMQCPDTERARRDDKLETALQKHWKHIVQSWGEGRSASPTLTPEDARKLFLSADSNCDGSISLDELVGHVDVRTAHDLMSAYDANMDGLLAPLEFQFLVGATAAA